LATRPQAGVADSLAMSGGYRRCSFVVHMATDRSSMAVQWVLSIGEVRWQTDTVDVWSSSLVVYL
jgi:hypothetical protein